MHTQISYSKSLVYTNYRTTSGDVVDINALERERPSHLMSNGMNGAREVGERASSKGEG